jgi:hypothetical protein
MHYLRAALVSALTLVTLLASTPEISNAQVTLPPTAIIVDDSDAGFAKFGPAASWFTATGTSFNYYGGSTTWTTNVTTDTINYARWSLPLAATLPLTYEVFAFVPRYNSGTINAQYQIVTGGVTQTRAISQSKYYAEWVSLGTYSFTVGAPNYVQLGDSTGETLNSRRIAFDALAFVPPVAATPPITLPARAHLPIMIGGGGSPPPPPVIASTTSRYIGTMNLNTHYAMGCATGRAGEQGTLILAFGQPWTQDGQFGVIYYQASFPFATTSTVAEASKAFLRGYWECAPASAKLSVAIGTNNYRGATLQPDTSFGHGQAWGQMINQMHTWLQDNAPPGVKDRIAVFGGNDIEMSWNTPTLTKAWVNGYTSATARPFVNFGTCDGCPTTGNPTQSPNNGWSVEDVWQVNGPSYAVAFPEIYLRSGVNADQWYRMSLYAAQIKGAKLAFGGLLTQWQACQDKGSCGGLTDNTPQQGWAQLQAALNADPRTAMPLPPPSDITWQNAVMLSAKDTTDTTDTTDTNDTKAAVLRLASGNGEIVEGVLPPISAMEFLSQNAWRGRVGEREVIVFAGLVRDPAMGGDDATSRGGVVVFPVDKAGNYASPPEVSAAPIAAQALRILSAHGAILTVSDGAVTMAFDSASQQWQLNDP